MKIYNATLFAALSLATLLGACSKDTEGLTRITYYPVIELEGSAYEMADAGQPFKDPGFKASLDGEDITDKVSVKTSMDMENPAPGYYTVTYSATNADGFSTSAVRHVLVADADDAASGYYTTDPESYRDYSGITYYGASYSIVVYGNGDGTYAVSDLLGGWYAQRAGYGDTYAMTGEVEIDADGNISLIDSYLEGWGDSLTSLTDGKFDADTGVMSWDVEYTEYPFIFHVIMQKD
jgi:hypothetical protein